MRRGGLGAAWAVLFLLPFLSLCMSQPQAPPIAWSFFEAAYEGPNGAFRLVFNSTGNVRDAFGGMHEAYRLSLLVDDQVLQVFFLDSDLRMTRLDAPCFNRQPPHGCVDATVEWRFRGALAPYGLSLALKPPTGGKIGIGGGEVGFDFRSQIEAGDIERTLIAREARPPGFPALMWPQGVFISKSGSFVPHEIWLGEEGQQEHFSLRSLKTGGPAPSLRQSPQIEVRVASANPRYFAGEERRQFGKNFTHREAIEGFLGSHPEARGLAETGCLARYYLEVAEFPQGSSPKALLESEDIFQVAFVNAEGVGRSWTVKRIQDPIRARYEVISFKEYEDDPCARIKEARVATDSGHLEALARDFQVSSNRFQAFAISGKLPRPESVGGRSFILFWVPAYNDPYATGKGGTWRPYMVYVSRDACTFEFAQVHPSDVARIDDGSRLLMPCPAAN